MKKQIKKILEILSRLNNAFKNRNLPEPIFIKNVNPGLKVHIGSGEINIQGWINIDARDFSHVHIVSDDMKLSEFSDNSIDEIYLCHILEHISFVDANNFVSLVTKKLKKGGILRIAVPSFDSIIKIYNNNNNNFDSIKYALMGGQDYEYNFHKSMYNFDFLSSILKANNFSNITEWNTHDDFGQSIGDWSDRLFKSNNGEVLISLNIKGSKI
jgi:predicted SAM-dependent methyltransferase